MSYVIYLLHVKIHLLSYNSRSNQSSSMVNEHLEEKMKAVTVSDEKVFVVEAKQIREEISSLSALMNSFVTNSFQPLHDDVKTTKEDITLLKEDNAAMKAELGSLKKILEVIFVKDFCS